MHTRLLFNYFLLSISLKDILIGMLSKTIDIRKKQSQEETAVWTALSEHEKHSYVKPLQPLKLVIMSATLRISGETDNQEDISYVY